MKTRMEIYKEQILTEREKLIVELEVTERCYDVLGKQLKDVETDEAFNNILSQLSKLRSEKNRLSNEIERMRLEALPTDKKYVNKFLYSDIEPYEVIEEITPLMIKARKMLAVETEESIKARKESFVQGGFCGHTDNSVQRWEIKSNPYGEAITLRKHKRDGNWYMAGCDIRFILNDHPIKHFDFNF